MDQVVTFSEITAHHLVIDLGDDYEHAFCPDVKDISTGIVVISDSCALLISAVGLANGRTIILREDQPIWLPFVKALPLALPEAKPVSMWLRSLAETRVLLVYERRPVGRA